VGGDIREMLSLKAVHPEYKRPRISVRSLSSELGRQLRNVVYKFEGEKE
jgi:hypothetical protein